MAIIIVPSDKDKNIIVKFTGEDATKAERHGLKWLGDQLLNIVIPRGKQPKSDD